MTPRRYLREVEKLHRTTVEALALFDAMPPATDPVMIQLRAYARATLWHTIEGTAATLRGDDAEATNHALQVMLNAEAGALLAAEWDGDPVTLH